MNDVKKPEPKHCDDYIQDPSAPSALRWFLFVNRLPAVDKLLFDENCPQPTLYADYGDGRVRVVMASRLGDVGITRHLDSDQYQERVAVEELSNFSAVIGPGKKERAKAARCAGSKS